MEAAGFKTLPYHAYVPSFGEWGFVLAGATRPAPTITGKHNFLNQAIFDSSTIFSNDMDRVDTQINRLDDQVLVRYFTDDWSEYIN
jgi:spermidine synthase